LVVLLAGVMGEEVYEDVGVGGGVMGGGVGAGMDEAERPFFEFSPRGFVEDAGNLANDHCSDCMDAVEKAVLGMLQETYGTAAAPGERDAAFAALRRAVDSVHAALQAAVDQGFSASSRSEMVDTFAMPPGLRLPDGSYPNPRSCDDFTEEEEVALEEELEDLRAAIAQEQDNCAALEEQAGAYDAALGKFARCVAGLRGLGIRKDENNLVSKGHEIIAQAVQLRDLFKSFEERSSTGTNSVDTAAAARKSGARVPLDVVADVNAWPTSLDQIKKFTAQL